MLKRVKSWNLCKYSKIHEWSRHIAEKMTIEIKSQVPDNISVVYLRKC